MSLPVSRNYSPMLALLVSDFPVGAEWQYEPKWDGFRCLTFRDAATVELVSRDQKPLTRYFPEVTASLKTLKAQKFVLDGEIVVPIGKQLSFNHLLMRIHPAESRIRKLATETPAMYLVFDILVNDKGESLVKRTLKERRAELESFARKYLKNHADIRLSPATTNPAAAHKWFKQSGGSLDGIIAKRLDMTYQTGERTGMQKIKQRRTADCVVGGFRYASKGKVVGSLLLGLYDSKGLLHHVGFTSTFKADERKQLLQKLKPLIKPPGFTGSAPGGASRWSTERSTEWEPLDPVLVVEVQYDHFTDRFRHGTKFLRWRPDKSPKKCTLKQVEQESRTRVLDLL